MQEELGIFETQSKKTKNLSMCCIIPLYALQKTVLHKLHIFKGKNWFKPQTENGKPGIYFPGARYYMIFLFLVTYF